MRDPRAQQPMRESCVAAPLSVALEPLHARLTGGVTLWQADLDRIDEDALPKASRQEQARAGRFAQDLEARRWLRSRRLLRGVLAWAARMTPAALVLEAEPVSKPRPLIERDLHYSLSHSERHWLLALAPCEVGVDIEHLQTGIEPAFARRVLNMRELRVWMRCQTAGRDRMFLSAWTAKEAVVKAIGCGLALPLSSIELPRPARHWQRLPGGALGRQWWLRQLPAEAGCMAALCAQRDLPVLAHLRIDAHGVSAWSASVSTGNDQDE